jgi:hypothetical protein
LVTTNRGLFLGSRPGCRTTSALMITRRWRFHLRAAYRVSPKTWAVLPRALESTRARPINRRLRFSSRRLLAMVTRYSTPSASRHSKIRASRQRPRSGVACCYSQLVSVGAANALCSSRALGTSGGGAVARRQYSAPQGTAHAGWPVLRCVTPPLCDRRQGRGGRGGPGLRAQRH